jgi:hypothetical protein
MSALGHKQTCALQNGMSALAPKADICSVLANVCFGPIADTGLHKEKDRLAAVSPKIHQRFGRLKLAPSAVPTL